MGNGSPHESCLKHAKIQADIDKVCRETGECGEDRKEIWGEVNKKPTIRLMCWIIGIIVSIFMAFMSTGFYVLSSQMSAQASSQKETADHLKETTDQISNQLATVKTDTEVIKVRVERIEHNNKKK